MDLNKLSIGERVIGVSAILLFLATFLTWFSIEVDGRTFGELTGWDVDFFWGTLPTILGLVMLAHVALSSFAPNVDLPDLPWPRVHLVAGCLAGALLLLKLAVGEADVLGIRWQRGLGLFVAALAGIGLAAGGVLYHRERAGGEPG